jgi:hypothetical protein
MWPLKPQFSRRAVIHKANVRLTPSPPPASHWKVRVLPGLAGATRDAADALWPQLTKGLLAPFTGLMVLILRTTLGLVG